MALEIKPEHSAAWEWAAGKANAESVATLAQTHLDSQGEIYVAQMAADDKEQNAALFATALKLSPASRDILKAKVLELAEAEGL